jgi:TonB family protein
MWPERILGWMLVAACAAAGAQQPPLSDAERLRRDAESPMRWIKLHAESSAPAPVPAAPAARPAPAKPAPRKAAAGAPAAEAPAVPAAPAPAAVTAPPPAPAPASAPAPGAELTALRRSEPQWDAALMGALRRGRVEVRFSVASDGRLTLAEVIASTDARLDGAALAAMRQWRFAPMSAARTASVEFGFDLDRGAIAASEPELVAIDQAEPSWDARVMQALRKGSVRLRFEVGTDGRPARAEVVSASDPQLAAPALEALRRWRFQPIDKPRQLSLEFGFDIDR